MARDREVEAAASVEALLMVMVVVHGGLRWLVLVEGFRCVWKCLMIGVSLCYLVDS